ncbi:large-conductance mechanosensitive channel protein MscL [Meridianimarinicoccus sp. RP-17]|uniref:large-conductance mechanosensitive channel protein MscL n=1 Tax=Meridianimarinicoccus zhengii TaxID=2056810 RepID=UPI000DAC673A|nr:large-conductance mechanosensitive channel protein MscL [Phycocomes zhengii]
MLKEFQTFIARGNVMDMAVGIIIGAAFTGIVNSLVGDIITPIIGLLTGGVDFSGLGIALGAGDNAAVLAYGNFITAVINFLIIAWAVFLLVKAVNRVKDAAFGAAEPETAAPAEPTEKELLAEIRDALRSRG